MENSIQLIPRPIDVGGTLETNWGDVVCKAIWTEAYDEDMPEYHVAEHWSVSAIANRHDSGAALDYSARWFTPTDPTAMQGELTKLCERLLHLLDTPHE